MGHLCFTYQWKKGKPDIKGKVWHLDIVRILLKIHKILIIGGSNQKVVLGVHSLIAKHSKTQSNSQFKEEYLQKRLSVFSGLFHILICF